MAGIWTLVISALLSVATGRTLGQPTTHFFAGLGATNGVPAGDAEFGLTGSNLSFSVEVFPGEGVNGGIYGPASPGSNGTFVLNLGDFVNETPLPPCDPGEAWSMGSVNLTPEEITNLQSGRYYVAVFGDINNPWRGQILPAGPPIIISAPSGDYRISEDDVFALSIYSWGCELSYQWVENESSVSGASGTCFLPQGAGACYCIVSNAQGVATSSVFYVSVEGFTPKQKSVKVATRPNPPDAGTVNGAGAFNYSTQLTLNATATNDCFHFVNWTRDGAIIDRDTSIFLYVGSNESYVVLNVKTNETVTANFAKNLYTVQAVSALALGGTTRGGGQRECGENITVTAQAKPGYIFAYWSQNETPVSTAKDYTFEVTNDVALTANFIPSPFLTSKGPYNGLFYNTSGAGGNGDSGMLRNLVLDVQGDFSAQLLVGGGRYAINGQFDLSGLSTNSVARPTTKGGPLIVEMQISLYNAPDVLIGSVSGTNGGPWTNSLFAGLAAQSYPSSTFTLPLFLSNSLPGGYALITNHLGNFRLNGALADGTTFNDSVPMSIIGQMPVYVSLYSGKGLLLGLIFNLNNGVLEAKIGWQRDLSQSGFYTNGFTNLLEGQMSVWTNPAPHTPAIALTNGLLEISGGPFPMALTFKVVVNNDNAIVKLPGSGCTNSMHGSINPLTGEFTIWFGDDDGQEIVGHGVIAQSLANGYGLFVTKRKSGVISLQPPGQ